MKKKASFWDIPETAEYKKPVVTQATKFIFYVNAIFSILAALVAFIPISVDEKLITQPTITNMIGIIGRDLGEDANRTDGALFLIIFFVGVVFIAVGLVQSLYMERTAGFFTFGGAAVLVYFAASWLMYSAPEEEAENVAGQVTNVVKQPLSDVLRSSAIPYLVLVFAILAVFASAALIMFYKKKD